MNIKEIVEGMTAQQVAQVIKDNFNEVDKDKANKTDLTKKIDKNKDEMDAKLSELGSEVSALGAKIKGSYKKSDVTVGKGSVNKIDYFFKKGIKYSIKIIVSGSYGTGDIVLNVWKTDNTYKQIWAYSQNDRSPVSVFSFTPSEDYVKYSIYTNITDGIVVDILEISPNSALELPSETIPNTAMNWNNGYILSSEDYTIGKCKVTPGTNIVVYTDGDDVENVQCAFFRGNPSTSTYISGLPKVSPYLEIPADCNYLVVSKKQKVSSFSFVSIPIIDGIKRNSKAIRNAENVINGLVFASSNIDVELLPGTAMNWNNGNTFSLEGWTTAKGTVYEGQRIKILVNGELSSVQYIVFNSKNDILIKNPVSAAFIEIPTGGSKLWVTIDSSVESISYETIDTKDSIDSLNEFSEEIKTDLSDITKKIETIHPKENRQILWLGTSIPEGCKYPNEACAILGHTCYNNSVGSSGLIKFEGVHGDGRDCKDLSESTAEKHARYDAYIGTSPYITAQRIESYGYDKLIIPYIDGTNAECDTVVFDHGYNDRDEELFKQYVENFNTLDLSVDKDDSEFDRGNFIGAFCFLVKKIWEVNPNIRIAICSYLENRTGSPEFPNDVKGQCGYYICELQKKIAEHFNFPYLNMCDYNGFSLEYVPNTSAYIQQYNSQHGTSYKKIDYTGKDNSKGNITRFQYYCPDGIHPHTDKTGESLKVLTKSVLKTFRDL